MADAVSSKERKKIMQMVKQMQTRRHQNLIGAKQTFIIDNITATLSALAGVNAYVSSYDDGYVGYLSDDNLVSFVWPLDMRVFQQGFRWVVPKEWLHVSKKQNIYVWAFREVYQAANEMFTRRLPDIDSQDWLKVAFIRKGRMTTHDYSIIKADFKGLPIVIVYRESKK